MRHASAALIPARTNETEMDDRIPDPAESAISFGKLLEEINSADIVNIRSF